MDIGLIAMSGIRVCDRELLELGLTLPGFVERSKTIASLPSLGLLTLAGMTPQSHRMSYIEVPDLADMPNVPREFELVAISSYSAQIAEAYDLSDRFRRIGVRTVMGGPHVTALPEEAARHCDAVVVGEGECCWLEVLRDAEAGSLKPIYGLPRREFDLRYAPLPAFELLDISRYNRLTVQTSRGCPHQCEFCASSVLLTARYKQKPAAKVLDEIDRIIELWDRPFIEFADDNTFVNRRYWKHLLPQIVDRGIRWFTETDISVSEDCELLELMRESGCAQILIGLESPTVAGLHGIELRGNWKRRQQSDYIDAIHRIQSHGITVNGCFVLGLDGQGPEVFDQVFEFVTESGLYEVQITVMTAFPGTPLYARLKSEGRILEDERWDKCTLFDVNFQPALMSADDLRAGLRNLAVRLYSDEFTTWRRSNFRNTMRVSAKTQFQAHRVHRTA
jgi:radical SAM superfamily enzyme YgiQ (UPF0313 family)